MDEPPKLHSEVIQILAIADSESTTKSIREIIGSEPDLKLVGLVNTSRKAIEATKQLRPDIVLVDASLGDIDRANAYSILMEDNGKKRTSHVTRNESGQIFLRIGRP